MRETRILHGAGAGLHEQLAAVLAWWKYADTQDGALIERVIGRHLD